MAPTDPVQRLGSAYVLDTRIGAGAQGEVWLAHRTEAPDTRLAVKLLRADLLEDEGVIERFIRERATLMRVSSPYVVGVRDMVVEGSRFAIVMDYVSGGNLRHLLNDRGVLAPAEVARVGACLAHGLAAVHDAGIVHRDIKPANVLIDSGLAASGAGEWTPRLADFGVARICDTVASSHATGAIGTPLYMAPEILDPAAPTPAADIYSLGVLLYEAASGTTPFVGAPTQVLAQHARRAPGRPDGIPDVLWSVLERMLIKQPTARPGAREVAALLESAAPALGGIAPAPRLTAPPPSAAAAAPYVWADDAAPGVPPTPTAGGGAGVSTPPTAPLAVSPTVVSAGEPTRVAEAQAPAEADIETRIAGAPHSVSPTAPSSPSAGWAPPDTVGGSGGRRPAGRGGKRGMRRVLVPGLVVVVLAAAVGGVLLWRQRSASTSTATAVAALPAEAKTIELQRIADADRVRLAPDRGALAARTGYQHWSLYDLDAAGQAPVWSGDCDSAEFWTDKSFLCVQDKTAHLIGLDGTDETNAVSLKGRTHLGTSGDAAIVVEGDYSGSLVALDADGQQLWRRDGGFREAQVTAGFVVTYETGSRRLLVLSADTGEVLLSKAAEDTPDFDSARPGGVGVDVGTQAFYVIEGNTATVYDATGAEVGKVDGAGTRSDWVVSDEVTAEQLVALLRSATDQGGVRVRGSAGEAGVDVNTVACTATGPGAVAYAVPERTDGEACVITPMGLVGGDDGVLFVMGQPSSRTEATGDNLIAYDLDSGQQLWRVAGTLVSVLPASDNAAGNAAGMPRMLVSEGDDLVVHGFTKG